MFFWNSLFRWIQWQEEHSSKRKAWDTIMLENCQSLMLLEREGNGTPLQYSCLENPVDRGAWWAAVHGVMKSQTRLSDFQFSLSCVGEGHGNPLQWSCLENPRDGGAKWAAVCGVAQNRTWLKQLSSSSSSVTREMDIYCEVSFILDFLCFNLITYKMRSKNNCSSKHLMTETLDI